MEFRQPFTDGGVGRIPVAGGDVPPRGVFHRDRVAGAVGVPGGASCGGAISRSTWLYRRVKVQEFLIRYDLNHPLVRAYRDHNVCVVNSFRSELAHKKAIFDLLTDESLTASFPTVERKAIKEFIPWTRVVTQAQTTYNSETVDLPEFILQNREQLVLKPNDESADQHAVRGWGNRQPRLGARVEDGVAQPLRGAGEGGAGDIDVPAAAMGAPGDA